MGEMDILGMQMIDDADDLAIFHYIYFHILLFSAIFLFSSFLFKKNAFHFIYLKIRCSRSLTEN